MSDERTLCDIALTLAQINTSLSKLATSSCYCDEDCGISCADCLAPLRARLVDIDNRIMDIARMIETEHIDAARALLWIAVDVRDAVDASQCGGIE